MEQRRPEKGAKLRVLRWSRFVQGDIDRYMVNVKKFTDKYGIEVRVDNEGWEDVRPKAAVAANIGAGPTSSCRPTTTRNLYPGQAGRRDRRLHVPRQQVRRLVPRLRSVPAARRQEVDRRSARASPASAWSIARAPSRRPASTRFPKDTDGFLKLCKALKDKGTPAGFALGNATGDANTWCQWLVWAFGGKLVDKNNKVVIDSPETLKALEYAKELYATFVPGTLSWLDPNNNKAFLDGQLFADEQRHLDLLRGEELDRIPKVKEMAADINHANMPIGPVGQADRVPALLQPDDLQVHEVSEGGEGVPALHDGRRADGPVGAGVASATSRQPLTAYEKNPIWTADPKHTPYRDSMKNMMPCGYAGKLGYASAGALADFIVVEHGGRGGVGLEDAEGSGGAGAEAGGALLQGVIVARRRPSAASLAAIVTRDAISARVEAAPPPRQRALDRARDRGYATAATTLQRPMATQPTALSRALDNRTVLGLLFMLPAAAAAAGVPHVSARPRHVARLHRRQDRPRRRVDRHRELRVPVGRRGDAARAVQHDLLHGRRERHQVRARPVARAAAQQAPAVQGVHPRRRAAAVHRADGAVGDRVLVDLRLAVLDHQLDADEDGPHPRVHRLPRPAVACALRDDRRQHLARRAVRRDHAARRPADDLAVVLRGREPRRRHRRGSSSAT